jgi:hypothetical protein
MRIFRHGRQPISAAIRPPFRSSSPSPAAAMGYAGKSPGGDGGGRVSPAVGGLFLLWRRRDALQIRRCGISRRGRYSIDVGGGGFLPVVLCLLLWS